ncbi:MAG: hypothetical protein PF495_07385 [Spirochaetales bacterium]|nr:hypothetical protein [Spirochaetales bacterium]
MAAIILFVTTAVFIIPVGIIAMVVGGGAFGKFPFQGVLILLMPFLYGIFGFVMTAIFCLIYNLIAGWTGGVELEFEVKEEDA